MPTPEHDRYHSAKTAPRQCLSVALTISALAVLTAVGCGETAPYIYKPREFDRNDKDFNKTPTDRRSLTICYNGIGTTDHDIATIAEEECRKYGKEASARSESFGPCPLLTPVAAVFACVPPKNEATTDATSAADDSTDGSPVIEKP